MRGQLHAMTEAPSGEHAGLNKKGEGWGRKLIEGQKCCLGVRVGNLGLS